MKLDQLKIIVTGGASGMGACFAKHLHEAGARVAVGDVNEGLLAELPQGIARRKLDVSKEDEVVSFVAWADEVLGGVNALVNNAGIIRDGLLVKKDKETGAVKRFSTDDWNAVIGVNLTGATFMVREVVARMVEKGTSPEGAQRPRPSEATGVATAEPARCRGVIVNMSSISRHGNRGQSNYVAAKAALAANTVTWAREFAQYGIRVTAIAPGMVETPMTKGMHQKARDAVVAQIPVGRIGTPDDLWVAVRFALECDYFNARTIDVDGGLSF